MPGLSRILRYLAIWAMGAGALTAQPVMRAHFLPVGQAHATLLEFSCGAALIDAGSQDEASTAWLLAYLDRFFVMRSDLNHTLDLILITHNHPDHTAALREIIEHGITVRTYVDNGQLTGQGTEDPKWVRANAQTGGRNIRIREVTQAQAAGVAGHAGLTDADIDPINCTGPGMVDPAIRALWGRVSPRPMGWSNAEFNEKNNHSVVTRVTFGAASALFTGDLEEQGITSLLELYADAPATLNADILQVGHHGSRNATTQPLLMAITPSIAVIPTGHWDYGAKSSNPINTHAFGHPRLVTLDLLRDSIPQDREEPRLIMAAEGVREFVPYLVQKRIYSPGWDGVVIVEATAAGALSVARR